MYGTCSLWINYTVDLDQIQPHITMWTVRHEKEGEHLCQTDNGTYTGTLAKFG